MEESSFVIVGASKEPRPRGPRKPKPKPRPAPPAPKVSKEEDPLVILMRFANSTEVRPELRIRAAQAAARYMHTNFSEVGEKKKAAAAAEVAAGGKFAPKAAPKLAIIGSKGS